MQPHQKINHFPGTLKLIQEWPFYLERTISAKILCPLEESSPLNMNSSLSHGVYRQIMLIYKLIINAGNKVKLKHLLLNPKLVVKVEEYI